MVKKTLIGLAILTMAAAALSFTAARWAAQRPQSPGTVNIHETAWLKRELGLTDAQTAELAKLAGEFVAQIRSRCETHCNARIDLGEELGKPQLDTAAVNACVERMCAAMTDSEQITLQHILRVRELLTPAQNAKYAALIKRQLCGECPTHLHGASQ